MATGSDTVCSVTLTFPNPLTIGLSTVSRNVLGPKIIRGKTHSFEIIFFSLSYSAWTALHITLSEAQRQFLKAFQSLVSSVSSVKNFSFCVYCTLNSKGRRGVGWDGWAGSGLEENGNYIGVFQSLGYRFPFLFFWWWVGGKGRDNYFVNKFSFPSSRCFLGSVQIVVLDVTFITMLYTVLFSLYS